MKEPMDFGSAINFSVTAVWHDNVWPALKERHGVNSQRSHSPAAARPDRLFHCNIIVRPLLSVLMLLFTDLSAVPRPV